MEKWDDVLELGPADRHRHGVLPNGMKYFVQKTFKPKDRAALALAVDVGSIAGRVGGPLAKGWHFSLARTLFMHKVICCSVQNAVQAVRVRGVCVCAAAVVSVA